MADRRDGTTWVALELTHQGEKLVEDGSLADDLRRRLGVEEDWPVFVPARVYEKNGKRVTVHLMEGYAFVATGLDEIHYFRLENSKMVTQVMSTRGKRGIRSLETINDGQVAELRRQLNEEVSADIIPGMTVTVTEGTYSALQGIVTDVEGDYAVVHFELRSLEIVSKVPKVFLDTP